MLYQPIYYQCIVTSVISSALHGPVSIQRCTFPYVLLLGDGLLRHRRITECWLVNFTDVSDVLAISLKRLSAQYHWPLTHSETSLWPRSRLITGSPAGLSRVNGDSRSSAKTWKKHAPTWWWNIRVPCLLFFLFLFLYSLTRIQPIPVNRF